MNVCCTCGTVSETVQDRDAVTLVSHGSDVLSVELTFGVIRSLQTLSNGIFPVELCSS